MKKRFKQVVTRVAVVLIGGLTYFFIGSYTGFFISCPFRSLTGLYCPGCGVTGLVVSLLNGNFTKAFYCNQAIFITLPFLIGVLTSAATRFIKTGKGKLLKCENIIVWSCIVVLLSFCVYRNVLLILGQ